jgi:hypothetical protein
MSRFPQPPGEKGSLKWIQRAVGENWPALNDPIHARLGANRRIDWRSPLEKDNFAEYRDAAFLKLLDLDRLAGPLAEFWPARGPQWDALGLSDKNEVLLVEAKAHVGEMCSPSTGAGTASRARIVERLATTAERLGARTSHAEWADNFYQLANRLCHLQFLRDHDVPAFLVLVNFLNDRDMNGPTSRETWDAAYQVAYHAMGLKARHALSPYIIEVFPDVAGR